ncbi:uncharacterized protein LOC111924467, partial [Cyanistes caeruleus]|uniref:uncharacterized protein LOC111924467 n=1 Tax=Cyanistes caeruleus TaxID=156563 RepID=UPI000CDB5D6C
PVPPACLFAQSPEARAVSALAPSAPGEGSKEGETEQEEQKSRAVLTEEVEPSQTCIKAETQAELPEAQDNIVVVKRRHEEDIRTIQEKTRVHQQKGNQQNQESERVAATPFTKLPLSCFLQYIKEKLQSRLHETKAKFNAREKLMEEEMQTIREKFSPLPQTLQKQVEVLTSHQPGCEGIQQMSGDEESRGGCEAQERPKSEKERGQHVSKKVQEKWTQWEDVEQLNKELQVCL